MLLDDPLGDGQAETRATGRGVVGPPEPLEEPRQIIGLDAGPMVVDLQKRAPRLRPNPDSHCRSGRTVPNCIVGQDGHELAESERIACDRGRQRIEHHVDAAFMRERRQHRHRLRGYVAEVERDSVYLNNAGVGSGEQEHVLDEGGHVPHLGIDVAQGFTHVLDPAAAVALEVHDARTDHGEWRAQLMACVRRELALALQRRLPPLDGCPDRNERSTGV